MSISTNQVMTVGAVAFAGFALWYITRTPGQTLASQPGQRQRDAGLQDWFNTLYPEKWYQEGRISYEMRILPMLNGSASFNTGYVF